MKNMIILYPGSFDPFHSGHLAALKAALEKYKTAQIWICPEPQPRGKPSVKPLDQRREVIVAALNHFSDTDLELGQRATLRELPTNEKGQFDFATSLELEQLQGKRLAILIGADKYEKIIAGANIKSARAKGLTFLVAQRGSNPVELQETDLTINLSSSASSRRLKSALERGQGLDSLIAPGSAAAIKRYYP